MRAETVRALGIFLFLAGLISCVYLFSIPDVVVTGYAMAFSAYPMSVKSPEEKISPYLKEEIGKVSPETRIPVVIMLTAPEGSMAVAQQQAVMQTLQAADFQLTLSIVNVANALAGTIPAEKIDDIAQDPNVDQILYDGFFFSLSDLNVRCLKDTVPQIGADKAWAQGYTGQGVTVIIIDSGVQNSHPYLMRNGQSLVLKEYTIVPGASDYTLWHGTHCAGIIASQDSTYKGVAPGIRGFVDIVAFDSQGQAELSWVMKALDIAYKEATSIDGPAVSTNSWGAPPYNVPEFNAVREATLKLADKIPVVFAAGNSGPGSGTIACPGDADKNGNEVITVGAVDKSNNIAWFSSRGPDGWGSEHNEPDVSAPGVHVVSTVPGGMNSASGTSMATPHVAGTVALMLSKNAGLSNKECLDILTKSAMDRGQAGFDYAYGAGVIQADKAVALTPGGIPQVPSVVWQVTAVVSLLVGILLAINPEVIATRT